MASAAAAAAALSELRVALCQLPGCTGDKVASVARAVDAIRHAATGGASFVVLPECFNCPYDTKCFAKFAEETAPGNETYDAMAKAAADNHVWLVAGSIPEKASDGKLYNSSMTFAPDGTLKNVHRKVHLFRIDTPSVKIDESTVLAAGTSVNAVAVNDVWKIGVGVCFDIRYPQLNLEFGKQGVNLAVYPGAFNLISGPAHWELSARSRAVDGQQYVLVCSPARDPTSSYVAWGHSMVVDPVGNVVASLDETEGTLFCTINVDKVKKARTVFPILSGTRDDLYSFEWNRPSKN